MSVDSDLHTTDMASHVPTTMAQQRYDTLAADYDNRWRVYNRAVHAEVLRHLPHDMTKHRVLDVGCGTGAWLELLVRRNPQISGVVGVEPSREMLNRGCERFGKFSMQTVVELLQSGAEELQFKNDSFDVVTCLNTLHYLQNAPQFFTDAHRVLDVGGTLIVQDYTHNGWPSFECAARVFDNGCVHVYTPRELNDLAENTGFRVKYARTFRVTNFWRGIVLVATKN